MVGSVSAWPRLSARRAARGALQLARLWTSPFAIERDRWFLWVAPLFAIGIAIYFNLLFEPAWPLVALPFAVTVLARGLSPPHSAAAMALNMIIIMAAGALAAKARTELVRAPVLIQTMSAANVTGRIEQIEIRPDHSVRLTLLVHKIDTLEPQWTPRRVRISLRKSPPQLNTGDAIAITARLAPPPSPALPRGYDFARAAYFQELGAVGYAIAEPRSVEIDQKLSWNVYIALALQNLRRQIGNRIETALPGEVGIMANALMTGERSGISKETNELYRDAGIFHILSISGLHMAIMGGSVFVALRFLLAACPMLALRFPIKKWAAVAAAIASFAYLLISGGAHPAVRSFIMILIMFLAILLDRPAISLRNVAIAALLILATTPESLFNAGFQLSFAAVVALVAAYESYEARMRQRRRLGSIVPSRSGSFGWLNGLAKFMAGTVATTLIAGLATAPIAAFHFHTSQQYSVLTNMLAIPVSNIIVMPAALAAFVAMPFGLEAAPLYAMGFGIEIMTWSATQVATLPGAVTAVPAFSEPALQLIIAGGLWLSIWRRPWRWAGLGLIVSGVYAATWIERPAALVGRNGELAALRGTDGRLTARRTRGATYDVSRWLEHDGDTRRPDEIWGRTGLHCDVEGCTGTIGRHLIALPLGPAALIDDCRRAAVLVIAFPKPPGCSTKAIILDRNRIRRFGPHAIYLNADGTLRLENVEQFRGDRPWTQAQAVGDQQRSQRQQPPDQ